MFTFNTLRRTSSNFFFKLVTLKKIVHENKENQALITFTMVCVTFITPLPIILP
jgi:hypothetical protein